MKTKFEKWIDNQSLSSQAMNLFEEATICYKVVAYKAGLLFSYLGFLTVIKERVLSANFPPGFTLAHWVSVKAGVNNSEGWDQKTFELTQQQRPGEIFLVSDTLRREVMYWKDRRNDCAHSKHEKIDYHHVESFWSFVENHMGKFVVNGGIPALIQKFKDHFNPALTPSGANIEPLILDISSVVDLPQLPSFLSTLQTELDSTFADQSFSVFNRILSTYPTGDIHDALVAHLKSDEAELFRFISEYPERLTLMALDTPFIRNLWYSELNKYSRNDFDIFIQLWQNNLITDEDKPVAIEKVAGRSKAVPKEHQVARLKEMGVYATLNNSVFPANGHFNFNVGNSFADLTVHFIDQFDVDERMTKSIIGTFNNGYTPNELERKLTAYFDRKQAKRDAFVTYANALELPLNNRMKRILQTA